MLTDTQSCNDPGSEEVDLDVHRDFWNFLRGPAKKSCNAKEILCIQILIQFCLNSNQLFLDSRVTILQNA